MTPCNVHAARGGKIELGPRHAIQTAMQVLPSLGIRLLELGMGFSRSGARSWLVLLTRPYANKLRLMLEAAPIHHTDGSLVRTRVLMFTRKRRRNDLKQASVILATFVYHAAMRDEKLPRPKLAGPK